MEIYENLEIEVIVFETDDVIVTSVTGGNNDKTETETDIVLPELPKPVRPDDLRAFFARQGAARLKPVERAAEPVGGSGNLRERRIK